MDLEKAQDIFDFFYPQKDDLRNSLLLHSCQVQKKALAILDSLSREKQGKTDRCLVECGALLHDIGIRLCHAPDIHCTGKEHYLRHGLLGAQLLREYGKNHGMDLEKFALICERHTGSGLTAFEILENSLPLPERDLLPESMEEKLICLADKFFSKSGDMQEKSMEKVYKSMAKFGRKPLERFEKLCKEFELDTK